MEENKIIALYWKRDSDAIARTTERYGGYCMAIARNVLQNEEDAEECFNDTLLAAWNSIPPQKPNDLGSYLGKLARTRAIDRWRAARRQKRGGDMVTVALEELAEVIPSDSSPEEAVLGQELTRALDRFLGTLSEPERNVFLLRYWYFEEISNICVRFDYSQSKVYTMLHRTRNKLKDFLQKEELL